MFVHPTVGCLKVGGKFYDANPTPVSTGVAEFFYEDARAFISLLMSGALHNFTELQWVVPHSGGAFTNLIDRIVDHFLTLSAFTPYADIQSRLWFESAGPSYPHAAYALLAFNVSTSHLMFGSDFPYAPAYTTAPNIAGVENAPWLTAAEKNALLNTNAKTLFAGKIVF